MANYPIGTPGTAWGESEKHSWFKAQSLKRSYQEDILSRLSKIDEYFIKHQYGALAIDEDRYPLFAFVSSDWRSQRPAVLITGGVHGYETSGVLGAIRFLSKEIHEYTERFNFIVVPCVSPWGYETINRWNPQAIDPNRSFFKNSPSQEAAFLMAFIDKTLITRQSQDKLLMHIDLHETTDTDNSEFRPALAARDNLELEEWEIPDGFYTVANCAQIQANFQEAIVNEVAKVTHIAPSDENGKIIGADTISNGVICYDKTRLFLCGGFTNAPYVSTTEVYPDSVSASPEICIQAQVAAITGGLNYLARTF